jgi:uroporphyrinogen decarboxylase
MNGRERVRNAIRRGPLDRVPRYDAFWEDVPARWETEGLPAGTDLAEYFDFDIRMMCVDASMRLPQESVHFDDTWMVFRDRTGCTIRKHRSRASTVEFSEHVTKDQETWQRLKPRFRLDPDDASRLDTRSYFCHMDAYPSWEEARRQFDTLQKGGRYVLFNVYGPWEGSWRHRGYAELLTDVLTAPDWAREMGETQTGLVLDILDHGLTRGIRPDGVWLVDDVAHSRGLLMAPDTWRQVFKPIYRRVGEFLRERGIAFWVHCCGDCRELLEDYIECGVQVLQPLQASAGVDVRRLKQTHGDRLTFWGNIDVNELSGSEEECEAEIREKLTVAKQGGGYIYHSDHSIPPTISFARYCRIMELVERFGRY